MEQDDIMVDKLTLCIDFDGVIHKYSKGWQDGSIYDEPTDGALGFVKEANEHFKVVIYTTRAATPEGMLDVVAYLDIHGFPRMVVTDKKPIAFLTIYDRAIQFTGTFPPIDTIINFKPWNVD